MTTTEKLLGEFLEKLKHKSVYTTLKKIMSGKKYDDFFVLKGLYSLAVHLCIEIDNGSAEYKGVLIEVNDKIQTIIKKLP